MINTSSTMSSRAPAIRAIQVPPAKDPCTPDGCLVSAPGRVGFAGDSADFLAGFFAAVWDAVSAVGCAGVDSWDSTEAGEVGDPAIAGDCFVEFEAPDFVELSSGSDDISECVGLFMGSLAIALFNFSYRGNTILLGCRFFIVRVCDFLCVCTSDTWSSQSHVG